MNFFIAIKFICIAVLCIYMAKVYKYLAKIHEFLIKIHEFFYRNLCIFLLGGIVFFPISMGLVICVRLLVGLRVCTYLFPFPLFRVRFSFFTSWGEIGDKNGVGYCATV
jgi:hypothetical protein